MPSQGFHLIGMKLSKALTNILHVYGLARLLYVACGGKAALLHYI